MLAKVKAELRAHVFEAVQQKDGALKPKRSVGDLPRGALMASLVAEYLEWSGCDYAARVFAAESGDGAGSNKPRDALARELGLRDAAPDAPDSELAKVVAKHFEATPVDEEAIVRDVVGIVQQEVWCLFSTSSIPFCARFEFRHCVMEGSARDGVRRSSHYHARRRRGARRVGRTP